MQKSAALSESIDDSLNDIIRCLVIEKFANSITQYEFRRLQRKQRLVLEALSTEEINLEISELQQQRENESSSHDETSSDDEEIGRKSLFLYEMMRQATNAVRFCQGSKKFFGGVEHAEAERILLFSTIRREAILQELRKENQHTDTGDPYTGTVKITNLTVTLKHNPPNYWHLCLLRYGPKVFCTDAIKIIDPSHHNNTIEFEGVFLFPKVRAYFEVDLCFYSFVAEKKRRSKFYFSENENVVATPAFKYLGEITIRIGDVKRAGMKATFGFVGFKIETEFDVAEKFKGFLTVGVEKDGVMDWSRRFCVLEGRVLKYWNYPQEEEDEAPPKETLNLEWCATARVNIAERNLCARPKTLLLEVYSDSGAICRRFLSADSAQEMRTWQRKLNDVVVSLRTWGESCYRRH